MAENTISDSLLARLRRVISGVSSVYLGQPDLADDDLIVTAVDISETSLTIAAQPDVPRNITGLLTDADNSVTATITVKGLDLQGRPVQEVMQVTTGTGKAFTGTKIFAKVNTAIVTGLSGEAAGDTIQFGSGNVIGLPNDIEEAEEVLHTYVAGAEVTPDAIATGESTSGIDCNGATYDGSKIMHAFIQTAAQVPA